MSTKELVEHARKLSAQIDPTFVGGRDANLLNKLADAIERLEREAEKWKYAFAAQSRKLQAVLYIPGVKQTLAELNDPGRMPEPELTTLRARVERLEEALKHALDELNGLSYIHDGNPSDAMSDIPPLDYARHMLFESRQVARAAAAEARAALTEEPAS